MKQDKITFIGKLERIEETKEDILSFPEETFNGSRIEVNLSNPPKIYITSLGTTKFGIINIPEGASKVCIDYEISKIRFMYRNTEYVISQKD